MIISMAQLILEGLLDNALKVEEKKMLLVLIADAYVHSINCMHAQNN